MVRLEFSSIVTALNPNTIGTKITDRISFIYLVKRAILKHDFGTDKIPGQAYLLIPDSAGFVSGGLGLNRNNPDDYVLRSHRGKVHAYLKREFAEPVTDCHVVVYTTQAYLDDPDIDEDPGEANRIKESGCTHVLVAVLASCENAPSTLSPYRFVKNLAGGNHEALVWTADEIRNKAKEIAANTDLFSTVAD